MYMRENKNNMKTLLFWISVSFVGLLFSCQKVDPVDPGITELDKDMGTVQFNFPIPIRRNVPVDQVHRIDLSVAINAYDLYRGEFLVSANVSDLVQTYTFKLHEGDYYFQAGITCSCAGDTCLWDGFPGGQWGTKWTLDKFTITKNQVFVKDLVFNN